MARKEVVSVMGGGSHWQGHVQGHQRGRTEETWRPTEPGGVRPSILKVTP